MSGGGPVRALRPEVAVTVIVVALVRAWRRRRRRLRVEQTEDLRYAVPTGQDAAAVLAKLRVAGYPAATQVVDGEQYVVVTCDPAADREAVRALVGASSLNMEGDPAPRSTVTFTDE